MFEVQYKERDNETLVIDLKTKHLPCDLGTDEAVALSIIWSDDKLVKAFVEMSFDKTVLGL